MFIESYLKSYEYVAQPSTAAITGHFVYTEVNAPNAIALMLLGLFVLAFARNNTRLKLRKK